MFVTGVLYMSGFVVAGKCFPSFLPYSLVKSSLLVEHFVILITLLLRNPIEDHFGHFGVGRSGPSRAAGLLSLQHGCACLGSVPDRRAAQGETKRMSERKSATAAEGPAGLPARVAKAWQRLIKALN